MSHAHTEIVEIKTMEDWEFYSTSLSIIMIGIFDNNDVLLFLLCSFSSAKNMKHMIVLPMVSRMPSSSIHSCQSFISWSFLILLLMCSLTLILMVWLLIIILMMILMFNMMEI